MSLANSGNLADSEGDNGDAENDDEVNINRIPAFEAVLRIRIRNPVPFRPLDPESGMGKKFFFEKNICL